MLQLPLSRSMLAKFEGLGPETPVTERLLRQLSIPEDDIPELMSARWWDVRGIGPSVGARLWREGMRDITDEKWRGRLPLQAQVWLIHKPMPRIPHDQVREIADQFMQGHRGWELVGSYRRERPYSGDVDILYPGDLDNLLIALERKHGSRWHVYSRGPHKVGGIYHLDHRCVEVDIWSTTPANLAYMRLYATGSKRWNVVMRQVAKKRSMKLNQYTLTDTRGREMPATTEEEIFAHLGMKYRHPRDRE